jgi:lysozyme family protein
MHPNVIRALAQLSKEEGGVADVGDGMGITRFGQTSDWLKRFGFKAPTSVEEANANYLTWMKMFKIDAVLEKSYPLGMVLLDYAVNATEGTAIRVLQTALNALHMHLTIDGVIGPMTLTAIDACDNKDVGRRLTIARQRAFAVQLRSPSQWKFASGWMSRLADMHEELL